MLAFSSILPTFVGHTIASHRFRLRLTRAVGCGAYGVVYLAQDLTAPLDNPRFYAVKCMLKFEHGSELESVQMREIAYHMHMSRHPHVTTLHEVIADEHYIYIVMDFYEGGDLFGAISERQSFFHHDDNVKKAVVQLLDAVEACHEQGIYHRDLKPENIMCSHGDSKMFLTDFGLATQTAASTSFGCGSAYYMSPECLGESCSRAHGYSTCTSDVWSIGIILVNMITGRNPWLLASSRDEGYARYLKYGPRFLLSILPVSHEAGCLLTRILDPNPLTRITIPELRCAVSEVGTFFPPEDVPPYVHLEGQALESSLGESTESLVEITFEIRPNLPASLVPIVSATDLEAVPSSFVNEGASAYSSESEPESAGPVTPETHSVEPVTIVPHLALAENWVVDPMEVQIPEPAKVHNKLPKQVQRFMGAIHRIF